MMQGAETRQSLVVLPERISGVHGQLRAAIDTLCVLEDFLLSAQVREVAPKPEKHPPSGVVDRCFDNLTVISNSVEECHNQLRHIIEKLGVATEEAPDKL